MKEPSWNRYRGGNDRMRWTFWEVVAAVALGSLIAGAIGWVVLEARARYEIRQVAMALEAEARKAEALLQAQRKAQEDRARARRNEQRRRDFEAQEVKRKRELVERQQAARLSAAALRDQQEGRYFPAAASTMKPDTWACKDGQIVRRIAGGWQTATDGQGKPGRCRTNP